MAGHNTRYKIKYQLTEAYADLERVQTHLVQAVALGKGQSDFLENSLSEFVVSVELLINMVSEFEARI